MQEDKKLRSDWKVRDLEHYLDKCEQIAKDELGLDMYPNQVEIITSDQMLERYSTIGLPLSYPHWRYGKQYALERKQYLDGKMGLAYELVINSNPCISYNMENNDLCTMILVLAHAACGHNAFFKMNYMFKNNTNADFIISYVEYANKFIEECIEKYGEFEVEMLLDACHALEYHGVDKHKHRYKIEDEEQRLQDLILNQDKTYDPLMTTAPGWEQIDYRKKIQEKSGHYDEENLLYFIEMNAPYMPQWKREVIRIVRTISQYFYPQSQTKVINEGTASFTHYYIFNRLWELGEIPEELMFDFMRLHTAVLNQHPQSPSFNPYYLGFNILMDIKRMSLDPTEEDKEWFPSIAGKGNWQEQIVDIIQNYRDDSFILQFMSPRLIREMKLFSFRDDEDSDAYEIDHIHDEKGYHELRKSLAAQHARSLHVPDIRVESVDWKNSRSLKLRYHSFSDMALNQENAEETMSYLEYLWGYDVTLYDENDNLIAEERGIKSDQDTLNSDTVEIYAKKLTINPIRPGNSRSRITITSNDIGKHPKKIVAVAIDNILLQPKDYKVNDDGISYELIIDSRIEIEYDSLIRIVILY